MQASTYAALSSGHRRYTVAEILRLQDDGAFSEDDRFELVDGEMIPVNSEYFPHLDIKTRLVRSFARACPDDMFCAPQASVQLSADSFVEPDLCLFRPPREHLDALLPVRFLLLAIEISATTLRYDLGRKARAYARAGLPELWVVDVQTRRTYIHKCPSEAGWASVAAREADEELIFAGLPGWRVRLKDL